MGKIRYYCDFCDRSFLDDLKARKKHLLSSIHLRQRKQYYRNFKDAQTIYNEEISKEPCRKHLKFNDCSFGENCKFCHFSPYELEQLRLQAELEASSSNVTPGLVMEAANKMPSEDTIVDWLSSWRRKQDSLKADNSSNNKASHVLLPWTLPPDLKRFSHLPISLQSWNANDFRTSQFQDWG